MTINLIPPKFKRGKEFKKTVSSVIGFLILIFIILTVVTGIIYAADLKSKNDLKQVQARISNQGSELIKLSDIEKKVGVINSKFTKIENSDSKRVVWSTIVEDIASRTPDKIQIKSLSLSSDSGKISISGVAATRSDIANFKEKMDGSKYFKNVTFFSSTEDSTAQDFSFDLSCDLKVANE
jgi:Tfp pilus assembly protein PilN